jgi:hypothetical protein
MWEQAEGRAVTRLPPRVNQRSPCLQDATLLDESQVQQLHRRVGL